MIRDGWSSLDVQRCVFCVLSSDVEAGLWAWAVFEHEQSRAVSDACRPVPHMLYMNVTRFPCPNYISTEIEVKVSHSCGEFQPTNRSHSMNFVTASFLYLGEFSCRSHKPRQIYPNYS